MKDCAGLTLTQWRLIALIGATDRSTAAQLSRYAAMDKGLISRNLKALGEENLVRIIRDTEDNRLQHLELTAEGRALFDSTLPRMQARQNALRDRLDEEEVRAFLATLDKLEQAAEDPGLG
ncbi:MarR family winged helix-turn-helix transcriptional regulator [Ponticoccus litoralis]|uniref:MarR family transcriptional regulator n=1 Tax=Ponticoccus litoralis TaxID=422297 RepID=A0AAW9SKJ0_9RHOB